MRSTLLMIPVLGLLACHPSDGAKHQADAGHDRAMTDGGDQTTDSGSSSELDASTSDAGTDSGTPATGDSDEKLAADLVAKLQSCHFPVSESDGKVQDDYDRCLAHCAVAASCDEIKALACDGNLNNSFGKCYDTCPDAPADGFDCGDGTRVPHNATCDLFDDCGNGADEKNCGTYTCKDGQKIPATEITCDGENDCKDGSDEVGCMDPCKS